MSRFELDDAAVLDLEEIASYIAQDDAAAARRWTARLFLAFAVLAATPGMGHRRTDLTQLPVLFWSLETYVIVYRRHQTGIQIVAVTQGSRNLVALLRRRSHRIT